MSNYKTHTKIRLLKEAKEALEAGEEVKLPTRMDLKTPKLQQRQHIRQIMRKTIDTTVDREVGLTGHLDPRQPVGDELLKTGSVTLTFSNSAQ